jgi:hypothetical protein
MKNKFAIIALSFSLLASWSAFAAEEQGEDNFAKHKSEIIADLNKEKVTIDSQIACISSSKEKKDAESCREKRRAAMEQMQKDRIAKQKAHLQEKLKELDEKSSQVGQRKDKKQDY